MKRRGTRISSDYSSKGYLFGWCQEATANHENCIVSFVSSLTGVTYSCKCECHKTTTKGDR